jgi:excisionase family DNA binding protein
MSGNLVNDLLPGANAAAAFTGLTSRTIYHMVEKGELPVIRKGRRLYFRRSELERTFRSTEFENLEGGDIGMS